MVKRKRRSTSKNLLGIISHMHIYQTFQESLIKTLLFLVAYLVSVLPLFINYPSSTEVLDIENSYEISASVQYETTSDITSEETVTNSGSTPNSYIAAGGALIIYGISLIAEVCMLLNPEHFLSKKLLTGSVLLIGVVITALGFIQIFIPGLVIDPTVVSVIGVFAVVIFLL